MDQLSTRHRTRNGTSYIEIYRVAYKISVEHTDMQMQCLDTDQQQKQTMPSKTGVLKAPSPFRFQTLFYQKYRIKINVVRILCHIAMLVLRESIQNWQVLQWEVILILDGAGSKRIKLRETTYACKDKSGNKVLPGCHSWECYTKGYCNQFNYQTSYDSSTKQRNHKDHYPIKWQCANISQTQTGPFLHLGRHNQSG